MILLMARKTMNKKFIFLAVAVLVLIGLLFLFQPKSNPKTATPAPRSFELVVQNKKIVSGLSEIKVNEGDQVILKITSDVGEEFHLHGYDKAVELEKGKTVELSFAANLTGSFPFELEQSKTDLGTVEVSPK